MPNIICVWDSPQFSIEEAKGEVDGKHVLGKVTGVFFVPNGISRNNRYYPREVWERVCSDENIQTRIKERRFFGTIGHDQPIDDVAIRDGKISHIVTDLRIEDGKGVGEALILDTPAGNSLNTLLRAGSKLYISTRAQGQFQGQHMGLPQVDPNTYILQSIDFVLDPGFYEATAKIIESKEKEGEENMTQVLIENLAKENGTLKADFEKAMKEIETLKIENRKLREDKKQQERIEERKMQQMLREYKHLGTPQEISKAINLAHKEILAYRKIGSPKQIEEAINKATKALSEYKRLGEPREISEAFSKSLKVVREYQSLGYPKDIRKVFEKSEAMLLKLSEEKKRARREKLSQELGVPQEIIERFDSKLSEKEIKEVVSGLKNSGKFSSLKKTNVSLNENGETRKDWEKPLGERLIESLT